MATKRTGTSRAAGRRWEPCSFGTVAAFRWAREPRAAEGGRAAGPALSWSLAGVEPHRMGIGPVPAVRTVLERVGIDWTDVDPLEINEAFAAQVLVCFREWKLTEADVERVNVNGSGISLGHPIGATGGRILASLLREMDRRPPGTEGR